ncbi:hypothetical protein H3Z85_11605 [Chryseobacterium indologenes]|jgi:hypothetical protein|uniref:hypothetical protein n=1 Tax=Chryseobacterium TaxID=59732 RepID=UPI0003E067B9|nr:MULTISPECIES: hypothetical protein [Chryseobacterium]MBF6645979.1 hypothetical protein [Chryseobacterium indologenes]MBU3049931.1 hypothetical protein [Chryseobacterium indologenes]MEB4761026.1 hypothetical protein [Chryseobacterium indologenes]QIX80215.1 hypothetical protein FOB56_02740 [Chryseobacterium indologenes]QPQ50200.1 hypothetical protein H3Z85_11605 [Chryseobacterium indologenes]
MKLANLNTVKPLDLKTIKLVSGGYQIEDSLEIAEGSKKRDVESTSNDSLKRD